jgi:hypothetical protein
MDAAKRRAYLVKESIIGSKAFQRKENIFGALYAMATPRRSG